MLLQLLGGLRRCADTVPHLVLLATTTRPLCSCLCREVALSDLTRLFARQVDFERDSEEGGVVTSRKVHRNLFTLGNPYPQKKVITFNRSQQDFGFTVNVGDLGHLSPPEVRSVPPPESVRI